MVDAADLTRQVQAQAQAQQPDTSSAPMDDPFPSLLNDPFPPANGTAPKAASSASVAQSTRPAATKQPDMDSESAFPSLGAAPAAKSQSAGKRAPGARSTGSASTWNGSVPVIQRSVAQQSFSLSLSHESTAKLASVMTRVQQKHPRVKIEASTTRKTGTTTFVLKAADEASIKVAQREITVLLAKHVSTQVMIPASLRAHVIGSKGKNLKTITDQTSVKIDIPARDPTAEQLSGPKDGDYENDEQVAITIEGDEINVKQASAMIQAIVAERTSKITQRLTDIDHIFYPFISGAKGANIAKLEAIDGQDSADAQVSVRVPPRAAFQQNASNGQDSAQTRDLAIIVSGDREKVTRVVSQIESMVDSMKNSFRTLAISIPKRQHRFLVGDAANDILATTDCSVELAPIDDPSDSVTIRGPQSKLPLALTAAMEKANAVRVEVVDVVALHRSAKNPIGHAKHVLRWLVAAGKMPKPQSVQIYLPRPAIVESSGAAQIEIVGSDPAEVSIARESVQELVKSITPSQVLELQLDPLLHRFIIGKKGQGLKPYEAKGVDVIFPPVSDGESRSDVLLVLSRNSADAKASDVLDGVKQDIEKAQSAAADIKSETLTVPVKYHRFILGTNGTTLNAVIGEERLVDVQVGSAKGKSESTGTSDSIVVRGPSSEVKRVVAELQRIAQEAEQDNIINGHVTEFTVQSSHIPHLVGRGGSAVTKLREELGVRIDFGEPTTETTGRKSAPATTNVVITGRKENVEEAKKRLQNQAEKLADETSITLKIPNAMHGSFIGQGGKYVTRLQDTYGVRINFPRAGGSDDQKEDEVIVKGGKKGVEGARQELIELLEYEKEMNNVVTFTVSTKSIARIVGRSGSTIKQIQDDTEAQTDVERVDANVSRIKLRGTVSAIAAARKAIEAIAAEVDAEETYTLTIAPEHHGLLIGPGGSSIRDLIIKAGGPEDAKSAGQLVQFPKRGESDSSKVTIRGPAAVAKKIRDDLEAAAHVLASRIVYGVVVAPNAQGSLLRRDAPKQAGVRIVLPGRKEYQDLGQAVNQSELTDADETNVVKLTGPEDKCKLLAEEILSKRKASSASPKAAQ